MFCFVLLLVFVINCFCFVFLFFQKQKERNAFCVFLQNLRRQYCIDKFFEDRSQNVHQRNGGGVLKRSSAQCGQ